MLRPVPTAENISKSRMEIIALFSWYEPAFLLMNCKATSLVYSSLANKYRSRSLNSQVSKACDNLTQGYYYCVKAVGGVNAYSGYRSSETRLPFKKSEMVSIPWYDPFQNFSTSEPIINLAKDTRRDCFE